MFYPGTGAATECGKNGGEGYTVNIPWSATGMGDQEYIAAFQLVLLPITRYLCFVAQAQGHRSFEPDLVLVSAGFDCAKGDPLGKMCITPDGKKND